MFKAAYSHAIRPMPGKAKWTKGTQGFKLHPPNLKRPAGRPKTTRHKEGKPWGKKHKCKKCGRLGHRQSTCKENVLDEGQSEAGPSNNKRWLHKLYLFLFYNGSYTTQFTIVLQAKNLKYN